MMAYISRANEKGDFVKRIAILWENNNGSYSARLHHSFTKHTDISPEYDLFDCSVSTSNKTSNKAITRCADAVINYPYRQAVIIARPCCEQLLLMIVATGEHSMGAQASHR